MALAENRFPDSVPGVFQARQKRSVRIRDEFIAAGVKALAKNRFDELNVAQIAKSCGNSVGSFYSRFQDKGAYFRALQAHAVNSINVEFVDRFEDEVSQQTSIAAALELLVDLVGDIFASEYRGVLRESLLNILEPDDPWEPMRQSAKRVVAIIHDSLGDAFVDLQRSEVEEHLSFCFQMIVGVLQNDLVNDYHVYSLKDGSVRHGLKRAVCRYMSVERIS